MLSFLPVDDGDESIHTPYVAPSQDSLTTAAINDKSTASDHSDPFTLNYQSEMQSSDYISTERTDAVTEVTLSTNSTAPNSKSHTADTITTDSNGAAVYHTNSIVDQTSSEVGSQANDLNDITSSSMTTSYISSSTASYFDPSHEMTGTRRRTNNLLDKTTFSTTQSDTAP